MSPWPFRRAVPFRRFPRVSGDEPGNRGMTFGLENVQKVRDGEMLGGGASRAEDDFDVLEDDEDDIL